MKHASVIFHCLGGLALITMLSACGAREGGLAPVDMKGAAGASRETSPKSGSVPDGYQVQRGDTVYALARKFDVPVKALIDANQIQPPYTLVAGQKIQVPRQKIHTVEAGDTLYGVSRRYGVDVSALVRANNLQEPYAIRVGQKLTLPAPVIASDAAASVPTPAPAASSPPVNPAPVGEGALSKESGASSRDLVQAAPVSPLAPPLTVSPSTVPPPAVRPAPTPAQAPAPAVAVPPPATQKTPVPPAGTVAELDDSSKPDTESAPPPQTPVKPVAQAPAASLERSARNETIRQPPQPPPRAGKAFAWPVRGRVIATFGSQGRGLHNDGINIQAPKGTPVRAAENGVVAYAGGEIKGFGSLLLIRHADGYMTAYAHNEALLVKRGDVVRRGQVISRVGATGNVDSPQLHFEVRKGSQAIDPEQMLGNPSVS